MTDDPGPTLGNRIWLIQTSAGPVIQKFYRQRRGALSLLVRRLATSWMRGKSAPTVTGRRETERHVLAAWRTAGFDVPADLTDQHAQLAGPDRLILEAVPGPTLRDLLGGDLARPARDALLGRFAVEWGQRHGHALQLRDPIFLQEHGSFHHVLVFGTRLLTIDFEQVYLPGAPMLPLLMKEIMGYLRSIDRMRGGRWFEGDLRALARNYDDPERLVRAADVLLRPGLGRRLLLRLDKPRRTRRKLRIARLLRDCASAELDARGRGPRLPASAAAVSASTPRVGDTTPNDALAEATRASA